MDKVLEAIERMGVPEKDVRTSHFDLYPVYEKQTLKGYRVTNSIEVTVLDLDRIGELVDEVVRAGADRINGIYFTASDEKLREVRAQAYERAVEEARSKAEAIAKAMGVEIKGVVHVAESGAYVPKYVAVETPSRTTPIIPGKVRVSVTIQAIYLIG